MKASFPLKALRTEVFAKGLFWKTALRLLQGCSDFQSCHHWINVFFSKETLFRCKFQADTLIHEEGATTYESQTLCFEIMASFLALWFWLNSLNSPEITFPYSSALSFTLSTTSLHSCSNPNHCKGRCAFCQSSCPLLHYAAYARESGNKEEKRLCGLEMMASLGEGGVRLRQSFLPRSCSNKAVEGKCQLHKWIIIAVWLRARKPRNGNLEPSYLETLFK